MWQRARFLATARDFAGREVWVYVERPEMVGPGAIGYDGDGRTIRNPLRDDLVYRSNLVDERSNMTWDGWPNLRVRAAVIELLGGDGAFVESVNNISIHEWARGDATARMDS